MSDTQYEVIKETFPKWAERVEILAHGLLDERTMSMLWGMADAMILTGQCGEANLFVQSAIYRAKKAEEARA